MGLTLVIILEKPTSRIDVVHSHENAVLTYIPWGAAPPNRVHSVYQRRGSKYPAKGVNVTKTVIFDIEGFIRRASATR